MNKILTSLFTLSIVAASSVSLAQPTPTGPRYLGVPSVSAPGGLSSNAVYDMIINYNTGSTGGISAATATNISAYQIGLSNGNYIARSSGWGTNLSLNGSLVTTNQTGMTNSKVALIDGGIHLPSALFGGSWSIARGTNYYGGQINWWQQNTAFPPPSEGGTSYTSMGTIGVFEQWGGAAVSAISPWMLVTSPNIRLEPGYNAGYGELCLGNEDAANSVYLNWNRGPTLTQYDTANYKGYSMPLSFEAAVTDASVNHRRVFPGIIGYAPDYNANADPTSGLRQGELWFQSLTAYRVNGGWAQNGANAFGSNTVFRMRTNMVTFDGTLGVNGTSKTHINGGSITNTDILTKIVGTDSNGKFTGATLSGLTWDGTTLTASATGGDTLWGTNATSGKVTNILGGVSVGANSLNVSNGTASFINLLNSPATPRIMVGGNQTSFVTVNTNSVTGTNGSGFFVADASGTLTTSSGITNLGTTSEFRHNAFVPLASVRQTTSNGRVGAQAIVTTNTSVAGGANLGALTYYMLENASSTVNYAGAIGAYWLDGSQNSALIFNVVNGGTDPANRNDFTLKNVNAATADAFLSGAFTATNGFIATGNGVATYQNTNNITGTNGSGFFVLDAAGTFTNSGPAQIGSVYFVNGNQVRNFSCYFGNSTDSGMSRVGTKLVAIHAGSTTDYSDLILRNLTATNTVTATNGFISPGTSDLAAIKTGQIQYPTNLTANIAAPDLTKMYGLISTNNNFAITGLSGVNTGASDTNVQVCVRHYQNTSGSVKTITIPVSWTNVIGPQEYTLYFTNVGTLSIERYPGLATNYVFTSN